MICIDITTNPDGYCVIRVTDCEGAVCTYCGYGQWPAHRLLNEQGIRL